MEMLTTVVGLLIRKRGCRLQVTLQLCPGGKKASAEVACSEASHFKKGGEGEKEHE